MMAPEIAEKPKFPRAAALAVARELVIALRGVCAPDRLVIGGSLRRRKSEVGDVEVIFVPRTESRPDPADLFGKTVPTNLVDEVLARLLGEGRIEKRGGWGPWNKYARHVASGIPVDFFTATQANWGNYLVCRTGGAATNKAICNGAIARGWHWSPYGEGFKRRWQGEDQSYECRTEEDVFAFAGLPFQEPWERA